MAGCCPSCGYDIRATPTRCPECGTELPAPLPTINVGPPRQRSPSIRRSRHG
jgi:hypothetical protein